MQTADYSLCLMEPWQWVADETVGDHKQLQVANQLFHHPLQPKAKQHITIKEKKKKRKNCIYKIYKKEKKNIEIFYIHDVAVLIETLIHEKEIQLTISLNFSMTFMAIRSPWSLRFSKFA